MEFLKALAPRCPDCDAPMRLMIEDGYTDQQGNRVFENIYHCCNEETCGRDEVWVLTCYAEGGMVMHHRRFFHG